MTAKPTLLICEVCDGKVASNAPACPHCGAPVPQDEAAPITTTCNVCDDAIPTAAKTCPHCGAPNTQAPPAEDEVPPIEDEAPPIGTESQQAVQVANSPQQNISSITCNLCGEQFTTEKSSCPTCEQPTEAITAYRSEQKRKKQ